MDNQGRGLIKALETWAKNVTKGYRDVQVRDMSASFRDGLAFCAIIHHYRPDLIDIDSLSKENIFENNQLAFSVAEKQLGVPALLDAEDMVQFSRPDRLSIITYLSQLHNCFENQNKMRSGFKRSQNNNILARPSKVLAGEPKLTTRRIEVCQVCNNRVFILERLIVDNKLYHTACFRCYKCNALLNPGAYVESDTPGKYECTVCLPDDKMSSIETDDTESHSSLEEKSDVPNSISEPLRTVQNNVLTKSPLSESVTQARVSFLQRSLNKSDGTQSSNNFSVGNKTPSPIEKELPRNGVSVKDKINVFESSKVSKLDPPQSFEQTLPNKLQESPTPKTSPYLNASLNKSPRPTVRLSKLSTVVSDKNEKPDEKYSENKTLINSTEVDTIDSVCSSGEKESVTNIPADLKAIETEPDSIKISSGEVTASDSSISTAGKNTSPLKSVRKDLDKSTYKSSIGEYKSPLKSSRDIFQANIQPLKLTIPTINTSLKSESSSLPVTPLLSSADYTKPNEIAQIRPSYNKSLTRPLSFSSLQTKQKSEEVTEDNSSNELPDERNKTIIRNSLGSDKNSELKNSVSLNLISKTENDDHKDPFSAASEQNNSVMGSSLPRRSPIPSIRHSIESKKLDLPTKDIKESVEKPKLSLRGTGMQKKEDKTVKKDSPVKHPVSKKEEESYPDDLNPFGDEEENEEEEYPDDLNPFGDDEEEEKPSKVFEGVCADNYDESKNPFASDEEETESSLTANTPSPRPYRSQNHSPFGTISSPTGSLRGTTKKRKAPQPPKLSDIFPNNDSPDNSLKPSPSVSRKSLETPSPKLRKSKPAPPPPTPSPRQTSQNGVSPTRKPAKEDDLKSNSTSNEPKKRKRPAPPVPIPMRKDKKKIPLKEILREMKEIESKQRDLETQGRQIELLIRDRDKDEEPSVEEEEYIMQLFELVNQKNALFRRQAELMYIKRSQRLEEQQEDLEKQIRELMAKPESEKSEEEKAREEELIYELTDIVDQRNSIIDSIEMDRRREMEEDVSVQEQIEIKNGDLPIAAELKEKNKGKDKKEKKEKKEKKKKEKKKKEKHQESGDTGKNTLRKKLFK